MSIRHILKRLVPPVLADLVRSRANVVQWLGNFSSWEAASTASCGYEAPVIFAQVREAALAVKRGEAVFERDGVLFHEPAPHWPLLAHLLQVAAEGQGHLHVLDYGGSLGSTYFQHRQHLGRLKSLKWDIVEQNHYVDFGRAHMSDGILGFHARPEDCLDLDATNLILLSSVLPYLRSPHETFARLLGLAVPFVLVDRTPFLDVPAGKDRLTIQHVPPSIYQASYPAWFFDRQRLAGEVAGNYALVSEFPTLGGTVRLEKPSATATYYGQLFRRLE